MLTPAAIAITYFEKQILCYVYSLQTVKRHKALFSEEIAIHVFITCTPNDSRYLVCTLCTHFVKNNDIKRKLKTCYM